MVLITIGDFSFARSLVVQHKCQNVLATCYDSKDDLGGKYPQAEGNIQDIYDACSKKRKQQQEGEDEGNENKDASAEQDQEKKEENPAQNSNTKNHGNRHGPKILFSVDARKLGHATLGGGKDVRVGFPRLESHRQRPAWKEHQDNKSKSAAGPKGGPWDIICFNFPHVGGLSTDVNRQVRSNQELLVAFFKACVSLLSTPPENIDNDSDDDEDEEYDWENSSDDDKSEEDEDENIKRPRNKVRTEPGQILVTLFESEPYTLWNIKDLARHAGLKVVTSFRFPWGSYEGYSHARTLGHIEGKHGGPGGWKGEEREARMYVFEAKQDDNQVPARKPDTNAKQKKRARDESDSDDND